MLNVFVVPRVLRVSSSADLQYGADMFQAHACRNDTIHSAGRLRAPELRDFKQRRKRVGACGDPQSLFSSVFMDRGKHPHNIRKQ